MQYEDNPPKERTHNPRPFGRGLRACTELAEVVTVNSAHSDSLDPDRVFSLFVTVVATTTSDSDDVKNLGRMGFSRRDGPPGSPRGLAPRSLSRVGGGLYQDLCNEALVRSGGASPRSFWHYSGVSSLPTATIGPFLGFEPAEDVE